jgi:hypothetical protein
MCRFERGADTLLQVGVNFTYISKIENEKLDFGDYPSEELPAFKFVRPGCFGWQCKSTAKCFDGPIC